MSVTDTLHIEIYSGSAFVVCPDDWQNCDGDGPDRKLQLTSE